MTLEEFLDGLLWFVRKLLGALSILSAVCLILKYLIPGLVALLVWISALLGFKITEGTALFLIAILLFVLFILSIWLDKGVPIVSRGCTLTTFYIRPDRCTTTGCPFPCIALKGPYPKWMGKFAVAPQDVGCICPSSPLSGWAPWLQKIIDQAVTIRDIAELRRELERLIPDDFNNPIIDLLRRVLEKLERGEPPTDEDRDEIRRILRSDE